MGKFTRTKQPVKRTRTKNKSQILKHDGASGATPEAKPADKNEEKPNQKQDDRSLEAWSEVIMSPDTPKPNREIQEKRIDWFAAGNTYIGYIGKWKIFKIRGDKVTNRLPGFVKEFTASDTAQAKAKCEAIWVMWSKGLDETAEAG